jgi:hypothetical protein
VDVRIDVDLHGPVLDGQAPGVVHAFLEDAKEVVANKGYAMIAIELDRVLRNPTPYYETRIAVERQADDQVVHDSGVIYGAWLEGVGSRNSETRFKGYGHWRRIHQRLDGQANGIADELFRRRYLGRLT